MSLKQKSHIYGYLEERKLLIEMIIDCYIINRIISLSGVTLLQIIVWGHKGGQENKRNE